MSDRIWLFLNELRAALPPRERSSERIVAEAKDHLYETAETLSCGGLGDEESQRRAIERFGSAETVARRWTAECLEQGDGNMQWDFRRAGWAMTLIGAMAMLPALFFVTLSVLKYHLGIATPLEPFVILDLAPAAYASLLRSIAPLIFVGGTALAVTLSLLSMSRLELRLSEGRFVGSVTVEPERCAAIVLVASGLLIMTMFAYVVTENLMENAF